MVASSQALCPDLEQTRGRVQSRRFGASGEAENSLYPVLLRPLLAGPRPALAWLLSTQVASLGDTCGLFLLL